MLNVTSSAVSSTPPHHLTFCQARNRSEAEKCNVLLVEPAMIPLSDRERVLSAANYGVTARSNVREMVDLRFEKPIAFVILNDLLGPLGLRDAAELVRRRWPTAKILIIGCAVPTLEDHLYDEAISHRHEESGLLDALQILAKDSLSQRLIGGYQGYRRATSIPKESDPTKAVADISGLSRSWSDAAIAPQRMRAAG